MVQTNAAKGNGVAWPLLQILHVLLSARVAFEKLPVKAQAHGLLSSMHTASCSRLVPYITSWTPVEHIVSSRARIILEQDQPDASSYRNQKGCKLPCQRLSETFTGLLRRVAMNLSAQPAATARNEMWLHKCTCKAKRIEKVLSLGSSMRMRSRLTD